MITNLINPEKIAALPKSPNPRTGCGFCEKNEAPHPHYLWAPFRFSLFIHSACEESCKDVEKTFRAQIAARNPSSIVQAHSALIGRTAVRIACDMPICDYLKQYGEEALTCIYDEYGIPAALDQIRIMTPPSFAPEK